MLKIVLAESDKLIGFNKDKTLLKFFLRIKWKKQLKNEGTELFKDFVILFSLVQCSVYYALWATKLNHCFFCKDYFAFVKFHEQR